MKRFLILPTALLMALASFVGLPGIATAQTYPSKPVTLIVPFPAGGPSDALARQVAQRLGSRLGQQLVVENVAGAGGAIGLGKVAKAAPDGHTLGFGTNGTHVANVALYKALPYDPVKDFEPIGFVGSAPLVLVAKPALPARNLSEFVAHARAHQDRLTYGSAGVGSISHSGCVMLLSTLKLDIVHVPYKGVAPAMTDLMGGQIDFMCDQTTTALAHIQSGKVVAIAALSRSRIAVLPGLQTAAEAGLAEVDLRSWNALFAPRGTPAVIVKRLNDVLLQVLQERDFVAAMEKVGVELPTRETAPPGMVAAAIQLGIQRDVPALKALGVLLD